MRRSINECWHSLHCARQVQVRTEYRKEHIEQRQYCTVYSRVQLQSPNSEFYLQCFRIQVWLSVDTQFSKKSQISAGARRLATMQKRKRQNPTCCRHSKTKEWKVEKLLVKKQASLQRKSTHEEMETRLHRFSILCSGCWIWLNTAQSNFWNTEAKLQNLHFVLGEIHIREAFCVLGRCHLLWMKLSAIIFWFAAILWCKCT